ncbi:MAG: NUDIX domain-containing protein [Candidatus Kerfeldbacteria bacterium]|nr:NUDIX domain-containing protein [Candidatus Kerfeldbacteria bacterium]
MLQHHSTSNANTPPRALSSKSVGAVVLNAQYKVLVIFQKKNRYWEFPKGKVEEGENEVQTLQREVFEETGIRHFKLSKTFRATMRYTFMFEGKRVKRTVVYYLLQTADAVRISGEHTAYRWLSLRSAQKILKHANHKKILDEVMTRIYAQKRRTQVGGR